MLTFCLAVALYLLRLNFVRNVKVAEFVRPDRNSKQEKTKSIRLLNHCMHTRQR